MSGDPPLLTIVVLNFRTPDVTIDCLRSLAPECTARPGIKVVLLDNASGDDSVEKIRSAIAKEGWGTDWLEFRAGDKNLGFSGGNNLILRDELARADRPRFLMLLNSDTIVRKGCIERSLATLEKDRRIGAMSCMLRNSDGSVQNICRKFPHPAREVLRAFGLPWIAPALFGWADLEDKGWNRETTARDVDWISGAFFLARSEALAQSGLLDEEFFFYGEDCEWCHRIWSNGWRIHFDPAGEIVHLGGASSDSTRVRNRQREMYVWSARLLIQRKCYGRAAEWIVRKAYEAAFIFRIMRLRISGRGESESAKETADALDLLRSVDPDNPKLK